MGDTISVWTPVAYLAVLLTSLVVFSRIYRQRKIRELSRAELFYPHNFAQDIYHSLKQAGKVPQPLLQMALQAWAAQDVFQVLKLREAKQPLTNLHQNGLVGDDLSQRFAGTEQVLDKELKEIVGEAVQFSPNWQYIIQSGAEVAQNDAVRRRLEQLELFKDEFKSLASPEALEAANAGQSPFSKERAKLIKKPI